MKFLNFRWASRIFIGCLTFALFQCPVSIVDAETYEVLFQVVDENGEPVEQAELSTRWIHNGEALKAVFESKAITDAEGKATIELEDYGSEQVVLGFSDDKSLGGYVVVERQDEGKVKKIKFQKTMEVSGSFTCSETDSVPGWMNMIVSIEGVRGYFFERRTSDGEFRFQLPPGKFNLMMYGSDVQKTNKEIETSTKDSELQLGTIDLEATEMARLKGKPAPELDFVDSRGVDKDFQLSDLKGKWVLIEFWGYW